VPEEVMLSVVDEPESDAVAKSGALGALGAVRSIVMVVEAELFEMGPTLGVVAVSATEFALRRGTRVPSLHPVMVIEKLMPLVALDEKEQPVAVPVFAKSAVSRPVMDSDMVNE
jgi:hypothetical protein